MKKGIKETMNSPFLRNVTVLATGTAAGQAISLISSPIITRLYGPEAYGLMGVFMAIAQIFVPIAALSYPLAIVLSIDDRNAKNLIRLSLYISLGFASLVTLVLVFFNNWIVKTFQIQEISSFLILIPLVILSSGLLQVSEQWLIRKKQFGINAKVAFLQSVVINASKIGVGIYNPVAAALIVLSAFGSGSRALMLVFFSRKSNYRPPKEPHGNPLSIGELAKRYKDFPIYRSPEVLINTVSQRFPVLILTIFFGPASAGFYTLSNIVLQKPMKLIGKSVGDVFYPRISEASHNKDSLNYLIKKATLALGVLGFVPFGLVVAFGPWIFNLAFGAEWVAAGKYAQWIAFFLFFEFINTPSIKALPVLSAQLFLLKFTALMLLVRIIALGVGFYVFTNDLIAIALYGVSSAFLNILLIILTLKRSKKFDSKEE